VCVFYFCTLSDIPDLFQTHCSIIKANLNCLSVHWFGPTDGHPSSSDPSSQSGIPSHLYDSWMHCFRLLHLNWDPEQVIGGQSFSSALSKQSLSPSQRHDCGMQLPELSQVNWGRKNDVETNIRKKRCKIGVAILNITTLSTWHLCCYAECHLCRLWGK